MNFRNIDLINSLIPVCAGIDASGDGVECICPQCCSQSSGHEPSNNDFAEELFFRLIELRFLLEKLSLEYLRRFDAYEIDFEDLMDAIDYATQSPEAALDNPEILYEHIDELWEMCEAEVEHYLLMTHPADHNDLNLFEVEWDGGNDDERRLICRIKTQSE